jgi:signal peptidase I
VKEGVLSINGEPVEHEEIGETQGANGFGIGVVREIRETLPNGVSYTTYDAEPSGPGDNTRVFEVPPDHYFLMGDNRDNSQDSRYPSPVGFVPAENLIGRAEIIFFSVDEPPAWAFWQWPWTVRFDRLFETL